MAIRFEDIEKVEIANKRWKKLGAFIGDTVVIPATNDRSAFPFLVERKLLEQLDAMDLEGQERKLRIVDIEYSRTTSPYVIVSNIYGVLIDESGQPGKRRYKVGYIYENGSWEENPKIPF
jgi:hypothetical protein